MKYTFSLRDSDYLNLLFSEWSEINKDLERLILQFEVDLHRCDLKNNLVLTIDKLKRYSSFAEINWITKLLNEMKMLVSSIHLKNIVIHADDINCFLNIHNLIEVTVNKINQYLSKLELSTNDGTRQIELDNEAMFNECVKELTLLTDKVTHEIDTKIECVENYSNKAYSDFISKEEISLSAKEKFFFQMYDCLDELDGLLLIGSKVNSEDSVSLQIKIVVQKMNETIKYVTMSYNMQLMLKEAITPAEEIIFSFTEYIETIVNKHSVMDKVDIYLIQEIVYYLREAVEAMVMEQQLSRSHRDLVKKMDDRIKIVNNSTLQLLTQSSVKNKKDNPNIELTNKPLSTQQSIRVSQDKLDKMMNMISELLITKNAFIHVSEKINAEENVSHISKEVKQIGSMVNRISDELQKAIMSMRMVEVNTLFQKMPRIIRDVSQSTGKKIRLVIKGESTEIDKTIIEQLSDPIVHLIRNAADHGIENHDVRIAKGKEAVGVITLRAYNKDKHVCIEIEDDGKGIDAQLLKQKAINKGFISEEYAEKMNQNQLFQLIFLPGFSTAEQVTDLSGRGVGMDVVKSNIEKINGSVTIFSEVDKGTKIVISLPLTLAVSRGLTINSLNETFIIPLDSVVETVKIRVRDIHKYNAKKIVHLRGEVIGIEWLSTIFMLGECEHGLEEVNTVIITNGQEKFGIVVDRLLNEQEFVIKTLSGHLASISGISGSTLLGSGQVVLIINPHDIIELSKSV